MPVSAVDLPFLEQAEFFRRKLNLPTESWTDIYSAEHDWAFVVAGANRDALVADFRAAVDKVIADGVTIEQFRKDFDAIVARNGWSYNGGRNWRSRVIYNTNLYSSYQAGRYEQLMAVREERPYWRYLHNDAVENPRIIHEGWHDLILRWDDPWWDTHFPINGWGCECGVEALSEYDLKVMGRTVDTAPPINYETKEIGKRSPLGPRTVRVPEGIDPGFEYTPGRSRLQSAVPTPTQRINTPAAIPSNRARSKLPAPQRVPESSRLPEGLNPIRYVHEFLKEFDADQVPAVYKDVIGEALVIGRSMFENAAGELALGEQGPLMRLLSYALQAPDEIWTRIENIADKPVVVRRYISQLLLPGEVDPLSIVLEFGANGWRAITSAGTTIDINNWRIGARLYRRAE